MNKKQAFTLAEVLVTLAVIGVVASLTIPSIIKNQQNATLVAQTKEAFSLINQATKMAMADGITMGACFDDSIYGGNLCLVNYLKVAKNCGQTINTGCFPDTMYTYLKGDDYSNYEDVYRAKLLLTNGMSISPDTEDNYCTSDLGDGPMDHECGMMMVDVNGHKGPNVVGKDFIIMRITESGQVIPGGSSLITYTNIEGSNFTISCNPAADISGRGCLARILKEGAINY